MKEVKVNGNIYKLPGSLNDFQRGIYIHLIDWKWKNITKELGYYKYRGEEIPYDAILPVNGENNDKLLYKGLKKHLVAHKKRYYFKFHKHFNHMASSQAANINLFLPILLNPKANDVFKQLKPDFSRIASNKLYNGFRIEFWDGNTKEERGLLGDHTPRSGTDSDLAITYYNKEGELCLWLIEHKLCEKEFTECGGCKSKERNKLKHHCDTTFIEILNNKNICYYHDVRKNEYWNITEANQSFFPNHNKFESCPFKGGMNQLWRNQLLGMALEKHGVYKHVYFSVVHHLENKALEKAINLYKELTNNNPKFSSFTSSEVVKIAEKLNVAEINEWANWYSNIYNIS